MSGQKTPVSKRVKGKISIWNDDKGFGFIEPLMGGKRVFIHIKSFPNRRRRPKAGEVVTYSLSSDRQGRPCATGVTIAGEQAKIRQRSGGTLPAFTGLVFLGLVGVSTLLGNLPPIMLMAYIGMSLLAYLFYYLDKSAARRGRWRTKESTLHLLALLGGWPGAWAAQQRLRHKSRKQPFRFIFWLTVLANLGALAWLHTAEGTTYLHTLAGSMPSLSEYPFFRPH
ncbi:DUF1294 domain-containing protein [Microbulbifer hydrolyticus]|uniref:DUF1294 domain-containing protein n=1 Tax=Microbulbifer hydrolyticus TaxID=48074 RepID=A0A6P1T560_9GAMM|nr:DUF1294 domain-containing protein [Microbulbifer hydrolyticus]MBB5211217.1 uncharacterized membrane protein YsdA (DUF1294 family)/cold shock CspA family protein [Microbulbifer hydrolyticus]QHQ38014.1 DUF1294 domain-containing protein [Microbulbifer hydrolyticus]